MRPTFPRLYHSPRGHADECRRNCCRRHLEGIRTALNASDTKAALKLCAPDGVFMPQHSPSSVETAAVRGANEAVFAHKCETSGTHPTFAEMSGRSATA